jgi:hypothetical protein
MVIIAFIGGLALTGLVVIASVAGTVLFLKNNKNKAAKLNSAVDQAGAAIDKATGGKL